MRQGLANYQRNGGETLTTMFLAWLAEASGETGEIEQGLLLLSEAVKIVEDSEVHFLEAELYRLRGELTLQQFHVPRST
jgi:hypothetical protein